MPDLPVCERHENYSPVAIPCPSTASVCGHMVAADAGLKYCFDCATRMKRCMYCGESTCPFMTAAELEAFMRTEDEGALDAFRIIEKEFPDMISLGTSELPDGIPVLHVCLKDDKDLPKEVRIIEVRDKRIRVLVEHGTNYPRAL